MKTGFDNEKYQTIQSEHIKERISKFDGKLYLDRDIFQDITSHLVSGKLPETTYFAALKSFAEAVLSKTNDVQLNPMEYVDRKTVEYKNPEAPNYPCPYISSQYSGMMYNKFC